MHDEAWTPGGDGSRVICGKWRLSLRKKDHPMLPAFPVRPCLSLVHVRRHVDLGWPKQAFDIADDIGDVVGGLRVKLAHGKVNGDGIAVEFHGHAAQEWRNKAEESLYN